MEGEERHIATPGSRRKLKDLPERRAEIHVDLVCSPAGFERVRDGPVPGEMGDKWFITTEGLRTFIHRSWTGFCYCVLEFETYPEGYRVVRAWVNRDAEQYNGLGGLITLFDSGMRAFGDLPNRCTERLSEKGSDPLASRVHLPQTDAETWEVQGVRPLFG
jgi:hypothetical protein